MGQQMTLLQQQPSHPLFSHRQISAHNLDVRMLFQKRLVYILQGLWFLFFIYFVSKTDRSEVQIDSKEWYLTLWCHQPHPGQSLNPQTAVEFEGQKVESGWIFQRVLSLVVQKHSYKLDYQDKLLVLKQSSSRVSCICFSKTSLVLSHRGLLQEKYKKFLEQFVSLVDGWVQFL